MKKKIACLLLLTVSVFFFLTSCGSKAPRPSKAVRQYYKLLHQKQFKRAYKMILPEKPLAITQEDYINQLKQLDENFLLKEVRVVNEDVKGDQAEVTIDITEVDKNKGLIVTTRAKVSLKMKNSKWYIVWPKKKMEKSR